MYLSDETWAMLKPALKQALGVTLVCVLVKWSKCPFLFSIFMREDFAQIFLKRLKRQMELDYEIYKNWLLNPSRRLLK